MKKGVEILLVVLMLTFVSINVFGQLTEEDLSGLFDTGEGKQTSVGGLLEGLEKEADKEPDIEGKAISLTGYPQNQIANQVPGDWEITTGFDEPFPIKSDGYLYCDKEDGNRCRAVWMDYYSASGCEMNVLTLDIRFEIGKDTAKVVPGSCDFYKPESSEEQNQWEKLKGQQYTISHTFTSKEAGKQTVTAKGKNNFCEDDRYRFNEKSCSGDLRLDKAWPYSTEIKQGLVYIDYTISSYAGPSDEFLGGSKLVEGPRSIPPEKMAFGGTRKGKAPTSPGGIPGGAVGAGIAASAAAGAAGLAWWLTRPKLKLI
ncbi:hypothetical protein ACFLZZ_03565 [Nanoarchaeota archaeon]